MITHPREDGHGPVAGGATIRRGGVMLDQVVLSLLMTGLSPERVRELFEDALRRGVSTRAWRLSGD